MFKKRRARFLRHKNIKITNKKQQRLQYYIVLLIFEKSIKK